LPQRIHGNGHQGASATVSEAETEEGEVTDDLKIWLPPFLTLLGTLIVVVFTAWLNTRAVLGQVEKGMAELRLELKLEMEHLRLELSEFRAEARP
jgi:hypothetical protein